jgi:hypothetical protein
VRFSPAWIAFVSLVGELLLARSVHAAAGSRLVYGRAAGAITCPSESELRVAVRARLGYDPFFPWADQTIVVHIASRPAGRVSGKVYRVDSDGRASPEREFTGSVDECSELIETLALAIAMTLDPLHGATTAPSDDKPSSDASALPPTAKPNGSNRPEGAGDFAASRTSAANDPRPANAAATSHEADKPRSAAPSTPLPADNAAKERSVQPLSLHLDVGAGASGGVGTMPGISAGFIPFLRARRADISLAIEGRFELLALHGAVGDRANVSLAGGAAVPCFHVGDLVGCAALVLARYRAEGVAVASTEAAAFFAAAGIRAGADIPMTSGVRGFVRAEGLVNFTRHDLTQAGEPLWSIPAASVTLNVGALTSIL